MKKSLLCKFVRSPKPRVQPSIPREPKVFTGPCEPKENSIPKSHFAPKVVEHPDAIKAYLVRQENVKIDLTNLAKLRFIENMKTPALCGVFGKRRSAIRQGIRTLRKCGISELNMTENEKKIVWERILLEQKSYGGKTI